MHATLPRLAFGEPRAVHGGGLDGLFAAQRLAHRALRWYEPLGSRRQFAQKSAVVTIGSLRLAASAHTPIRVAVDASEDITLMVPLRGWSTAVIEGRESRWLAGRSAMYIPGMARRGESGPRSTLTIGLEAADLERAACSVAGVDDASVVRPLLAVPQLLPLLRERYSFAGVLRRICGLVDTCFDGPDQLRLLGVDDMLYRAVAMLLLPESTLAGAAAAAAPVGRRAIDRACDHILAHLFAPIRLDDLEAASGLKARALQLAFRKRFGRTPRAWILDRRLDAARTRLTEEGAHRTVAAVALECGFTRISSFSRAYERRFGELPSATVARQPCD